MKKVTGSDAEEAFRTIDRVSSALRLPLPRYDRGRDKRVRQIDKALEGVPPDERFHYALESIASEFYGLEYEQAAQFVDILGGAQHQLRSLIAAGSGVYGKRKKRPQLVRAKAKHKIS